MQATVLPAVPSNVRVPVVKEGPTGLAEKLEVFIELSITQQHRRLDIDEAKRLRELTDQILEAGSIPEADLKQVARRAPRTAMRLKVNFSSSKEAAQAFTRDVGTGGIAIETDVPMHAGMMLSLQLAIPGEGKPIKVQGEVVWAKEGAVGIAFKDLGDAENDRLKSIVAQSGTFLDRLRARIGPSRAIENARLSVAPSILLQTHDRVLFDTAAAVLGLRGYHATDALPPSVLPALIAADGHHVANATAAHPGVPFIVLNASGMESLVGKLSKLRPLGFVKRPATGVAVADAVESAISEASMSAAS